MSERLSAYQLIYGELREADLVAIEGLARETERATAEGVSVRGARGRFCLYVPDVSSGITAGEALEALVERLWRTRAAGGAA